MQVFRSVRKSIFESEIAKDTLIGILRTGLIPRHVAFIMDGNRRYARLHGIPVPKGHSLGAQALKRVVELCFQLGIKCVTVYAFSLENFNRTSEEVSQLMELLQTLVNDCTQAEGLAERYECSIKVIGRMDRLDDKTRKTFENAIPLTSKYGKTRLNVAMAYTSRDEMTRAIRATVEQSSAEGIDSITAASLSARMDTASDPPLDMLVRSSGVHRLSDFLLWQCHQDTDIQVVESLWPDVGLKDLFWVIFRWQTHFSSRGRLA